MPPYKKCSSSFILAVATNQKKHLELINCCAKKVPSWPELKISLTYETITQ